MSTYRLRLRRPRFRGGRTPLVRREQSAIRLTLLGVVSGLAIVPIWWWTTQTVDGQRIADLILHGRVIVDPAAAVAASETLASVSLTSAAIVTVALAALALRSGGVALAITVMVIVTGANVTAQLLKRWLERPDLLGSAAYAFGNSFPSGHVTLTASILFAAVLVAPRRLRTWLAVLSSGVCAVVGLSTIVLGWHRLADVVGAILLALAWASLPAALLVSIRGRMPRRTWGSGKGGAVTGVASFIGGAIVIAGVIALLADALDPRPLGEILAGGPADPRTLSAAALVAIGSSVAGFASLVWALKGVALETPR